MKKTIVPLILFSFLLFNTDCLSQYEVVFSSNPGSILDNQKSGMLQELKNNWGATGVSIWIFWGAIAGSPENIEWQYIDAVIDSVINNNLDVYIRVAMGCNMPEWVVPDGQYFQEQDFQIKKDCTIFWQYNENNCRPLNFVSENSKYYMLSFLGKVCQHMLTRNINIKEIVPSVSVDSEMEYPYAVMCGYSEPEKQKFRQYLIEKYSNDIEQLSNRWGITYNSFDEINPANYNWDISAPYNYQCAAGRVDWLDYRTKALKDFIDVCADTIHHYNNFKMGLQLGSIYDYQIERRGWYDPTQLIENVDAVRVADIIEYKYNFSFAADYLRSLCDYWTTLNGRTHLFSTESNWHDYGNYPATILDADWTTQMSKYHERGTNSHHIVFWDKPVDTLVLYESLYPNFKYALTTLSGGNIISINNSKAVHLSCEQGNSFGNPYEEINIKNITYKIFNFYNSISPREVYLNNPNNYDGQCDIITNYMIINSNIYINRYASFFFTKSSNCIPDAAYYNLMKLNVQMLPMDNATQWDNSGHGEFAYTQGLKNEYNDTRSPIHLIWRSRPDLQAIWPDANLPDTGSGWTQDFIYWAKNYGSENADNPEYPGWFVYDEETRPNLYIYDENIKKVWDEREDLQNYYCDAHYRCTGSVPVSMIEWAKCCGYSEHPLLANYFIWPYIGGVDFNDNFKKNTVNNQSVCFSLGQNYPNPFNPKTKIAYTISIQSLVTLKIYDILGREVKTLVNEVKSPGSYWVEFDASSIASGIYFYKLEAGYFKEVKKMIVIK